MSSPIPPLPKTARGCHCPWCDHDLSDRWPDELADTDTCDACMKPIRLDYDLECPECGHERDPSQIDAFDIAVSARRTKADEKYLKWVEEQKSQRLSAGG